MAILVWVAALSVEGCRCGKASVASASTEADGAVKAESTPPKTVSYVSPPMEGEAPRAQPQNTHILGQVIEIKPVGMSAGAQDACATYPCKALVKVVSITQYGMNYHGQYEPGAMLDVLFEFSLTSSAGLFPEVSPVLPGLSVGNHFEAELFERIGETDRPYVIKTYTKTQ